MGLRRGSHPDNAGSCECLGSALPTLTHRLQLRIIWVRIAARKGGGYPRTTVPPSTYPVEGDLLGVPAPSCRRS